MEQVADHQRHIGMKYQAARGAGWSAISIAYTTLVQFVATVVLARFLAPSDFGLLGMMMAAVGLVGFFSDAGVSNAIIYHQDATKEELSSLYWLSLLVGGGLFAVVVFSCPLAVTFFKEPRLAKYLPWLATSLVIVPIGQQFGVLLRKDLRFKTLTKISIVSATVSSITAIVLALMGLGIWSLVIRHVVGACVTSVVLLAVGIRNEWFHGLYFSPDSLKRYVSFGLFQMGERFVNYLYANVDYLVIGRYLGAQALGYYSLAYGLVTLPILKINPMVTSVAFPAFAKMQLDDEKIRRAYLKMVKYISTCSFPLMGGMLMVAHLFIPVVYGPTWVPAVPVLQILCVVGTLKSLGNPIGSLLLAKGRPDIGLYSNVLAFGIMAIANLTGVKWGILGVAWSTVMVAILLLWPVDFWLRWYLVRMKVTEYFASLRVSSAALGMMMVLLWCSMPLWSEMNDMAGLVLSIVAGGGFYLLVIWIIGKPMLLELKEAVFSRG